MDENLNLSVDYGGIYDRAVSDVSDSEYQSSSATGSEVRKRTRHRIFHPGHHRKTSPNNGSVEDLNLANRPGGASENGDSSGNRIQDKIFAKLLQQMIPSDYDIQRMEKNAEARRDKDRPQFSLTLMSGNFRRFNARYELPFTGSNT